MRIETKRLLIRDLKTDDAIPFIEMAADGSLKDIGFDKDCSRWMAKWIAEAKEFAVKDNPHADYLAYAVTLKNKKTVIGSVGCSYYEDLQETGAAYFIGAKYRNHGYAVEAVKAYIAYLFHHYSMSKIIATIKEENTASRKVIEKAGFIMTAKKMYRDLNDDKEEPYCFYEFTK